MKKHILIFLIVVLGLICSEPAIAGTHSLGVGFHYFYALDDIRSDLEDDFRNAYHRDGIAINASYKYKPNKVWGLICELQTFPDGYYDAEDAISPRLLVVIGDFIYAGGGVAWNYTSWSDLTEDFHESEHWSDPYFLIRGGLNLPFILPKMKLDINASYEFNEWNDLDYFNSDTITFGATLRISVF